MLNYKRSILVVCLIILISYVVYEIRKAESNYTDLAKNGTLAIATISDKSERIKREKVVYHYSFEVKGISYKKVVKYDYHWKDQGLNIGDSIYILYFPNRPDFNCDYKYLKENDYGVDTNKYGQEMQRIGFYERSFPIKTKYIKVD